MNRPDLSIVIVNYNVEHFLELCLHSVQKAINGISAEVWVVDNHSSDGSVPMVSTKFPWVKLISNQENIGFSRANNLAIRQSEAPFLLLLNPDTVLAENCLSTCLNFMLSNPRAGAVGGKMTDGSGTFLPESKRGLPTPWVSFCKAFGLAALFPDSPRFGKYYLSYLPENETHEVDVLSGAFMFMRKEALEKSGLLDEDFFMYGEDVDLSYRIQKAGYSNFYVPDARLLHFKGESTKRGSFRFVLHFYKAMLLFSRKHFQGQPAFSLFIYLGIGLRAFLAFLKRIVSYSGAFFLEFVLAFLGMAFIKNWWELNFKGVPGMYPDFFIQLLVPVYLAVWIGSTRFLGRFSREFNHSSILQGIALGTILISGITNFFDDYRFSKGLILIGAVWTYLIVTLRFMVAQWLSDKSAFFQYHRKDRVLVVGDEEHYFHARRLLQSFERNVVVAGWVGDASEMSSSPEALGNLENIQELAYRLGLDEILFCLGSLSNRRILETIQQYRSKQLRFSFLVPNGDFIVSSSDKHHRGKVFHSDSIPELLKPYNLRKKRLTDLVTNGLVLVFLPFFLFRGLSSAKFSKAWWEVLKGRKTWIGPESHAWEGFGLKPAVISMKILAGTDAHPHLTDRLDALYLKEYHPGQEIWTVLKNLHKIRS